MNQSELNKNPVALEDNLKKALTELLVLKLLSQREFYIGELTTMLKEISNDALNIVFPYGAIYRLQQAEYIAEGQKRVAPDGRRRQFYTITPKGSLYLSQILSIYSQFIQGVDNVISWKID